MKYTAAVLTISDKGSRGERVDTAGPACCEMIAPDFDIIYTNIIPDEGDQIRAELIKCCDELHAALVLTTGGTGFSPRDVTPEATLAVIERETRGIPEAMRAESMRITPRGCLSRAAAGIRGGSLIVNLPGSERAARENLAAVLDAIGHGMDMLASSGSADCASPVPAAAHSAETHSHAHHEHAHHDHAHGQDGVPSMDAWLREAKADPSAAGIGMFLTHNGVVRATARAQVRDGAENTAKVTAMRFSYDRGKVDAAVNAAKALPGIGYVRVWLNSGELKVGDDIMYVLIGGDIRPHVVDALNTLVGTIKSECVTEEEIY